MVQIDITFTGNAEEILRKIQDKAQGQMQTALSNTGAAALAILSRVYAKKVYQAPLGVFGYPRNQAQLLATTLGIKEETLKVSVFPTRKEATYVEFGTGIFSSIGPRNPIRSRSGKSLAFPAWTVPGDLKVPFIPREKVTGSLPAGALGLVLAKTVKGQPARPVFGDEQAISLIKKVFKSEIEKAFK